MNQTSQTDNLYGLQVGKTAVIEPTFGATRARETNGKWKVSFVSNENLCKYPVSKSVREHWKAGGFYDGYALIDPKLDLVFRFWPVGEGQREEIVNVYVGSERIVIPDRLRDAVPHVDDTLVAMNLHPAARRPGVARTTWSAEWLTPLCFTKPALMSRVLRECDLKEDLLPFLGAYMEYVHNEAPHLPAKKRKEHTVALQAVCDSKAFASLHPLARVELTRLQENGEPPFQSAYAVAPRPIPDGQGTGRVLENGDNKDEESERRSPMNIPITHLDLGDTHE